MRKLTSFVLFILLIVLTTGSASAERDMQELKFQNQGKSIKVHEKMISKIEADKSKYIDSFAGVFIDEEGILNVAVASSDEDEKNAYKELDDTNLIRIVEVENSLEELNKYKDRIMNDEKEMIEAGIKLSGVSVSRIDNAVVIYVNDLTESNKDILADKYPNTITVDEGVQKNEVSVYNGDEMGVGSSSATVGFGARRRVYESGIGWVEYDGIVSTGHYSVSVGTTVEYDGYNIGTLSIKVQNADTDSSFTTLSTPHINTYYIDNSGYKIDGTAYAIQGMTTYLNGMYTSGTGTITAVNVDNVSGVNTFKHSVSTQNGDSGAPVVVPVGLGKGNLLGIHCSGNGTYAWACYIGEIIDELDLISVKQY